MFFYKKIKTYSSQKRNYKFFIIDNSQFAIHHGCIPKLSQHQVIIYLLPLRR